MIVDATDEAVSVFDRTPGLEKRIRNRLVHTAAVITERG